MKSLYNIFRDTTVQSLTLQPTVRDGVVKYEDSPLVTAVRTGHVLVVDEADKAPTHVTCILKVYPQFFISLVLIFVFCNYFYVDINFCLIP